VAHFPHTPAFTGFNTPSRIEADIADLDMTGAVPVELDGRELEAWWLRFPDSVLVQPASERPASRRWTYQTWTRCSGARYSFWPGLTEKA